METVKERTLVWAREDNERRSRVQSELERDDHELAELEILFATVRLQHARKCSGHIRMGNHVPEDLQV